MALEVATSLERQMVDLINQARADQGLDPLLIELHLNDAAQGHSEWMAANGTMSHDGRDGSSPTERMEAAGFPLTGSWATRENVGYISLTGRLDRSEVEDLHQALMNSASHRANILSDEVRYVGLSLEVGTFEANGHTYETVFVTQNFATTAAEVMVQGEEGGEDVAVPHVDGEPSGSPIPIDDEAGGNGDDDDDPDTPDGGDGGDPDTPDDGDDGSEEDEEGNDSGGSCFVATAAYGRAGHPDVVDLRRFRDEVLVRSVLGRAFVRAYWVAGPVMARHVRHDGATGRASRAALMPVVRMARFLTGR